MMHLLRKYDVARFTRNDAMFAQNISKATSLGEAVIISDSDIIYRKANIIEKTLVQKNMSFFWLRRRDLNQRPSGYEPDELPTAPLRDIELFFGVLLLYTITNKNATLFFKK